MGKLKREIRKFAVRIANRFPVARRLVRMGLNWNRRRLYRKISSEIEIEPKTILFESFMGKNYADNPRAIYEYMLSDDRFNDYTFIWVFDDKQISEYLLLSSEYDLAKDDEEMLNRSNLIKLQEPALERAEIVRYRAGSYHRACARAGIWISNSHLLGYLALKEGQKYIQTWHGTPFKRLAHDIEIGKNANFTKRELTELYDEDSRRFTAMISSGPFTTKVYKSSFDLASVNPDCDFWEIGYPRNDRLCNTLSEVTVKLKQEYDLPEDKQIILYAPTWRDNQYQAGIGYTYQGKMDFDRLYEKFGSTHVILFRPHYFIAGDFNFEKYKGFVFDACKVNDINDLYLISDMLVTDYSSVFFDYAVLKRPILFYMYDLADYKDKLRGFYLDLAELPGPIVEEMDSLIDKIVHVPEIDERYHNFVQKYAPLEDGKASQRACEQILSLNL